MTTEETKERGHSTNEAVKEGHGSVVEKQPRVPRNYESIEKGALALDLKERVSLRDKLTTSIEVEITQLEATFNEAKKLIGK